MEAIRDAYRFTQEEYQAEFILIEGPDGELWLEERDPEFGKKALDLAIEATK